MIIITIAPVPICAKSGPGQAPVTALPKPNSNPPWSSIRELQHAANNLENDEDSDEAKKWLAILMAPGSSLGGARPKANILDENKDLLVAKFPSKMTPLTKDLGNTWLTNWRSMQE